MQCGLRALSHPLAVRPQAARSSARLQSLLRAVGAVTGTSHRSSGRKCVSFAVCANSKPQSRQPGSQQQANPRGDTGQEALKLGERRAVARTARIGTAPRASAGLQAGERLAEAARASSPSQCPRCPAPPGLPPLWPQGRWLPDREGASVSPGRHPDASPVRVWQGGQRPLLQPQVSGNHGRGPASPAFSFF